MTWRVISDPSTRPKFLEAIEWFRRRVPMSDADFARIVIAANQIAFRVAGIAQLDMVADVQRSIERALSQGESFADWKRRIRERLLRAWRRNEAEPANPAWRLETIFRTNVQSAYAAGRYEQLTDPVILEARPYWLFDAILDERTTEACSELNGLLLPANDPRWDGRIPPIHFNCRSGLRSLRERQALRRGVSTTLPEHEAQPGFGGIPSTSRGEPDPSRYPADLWAAYEARNEGA